MNKIEVPKVFISYSWSNRDHENWVLNFSKKLTSDGVNIILDKWELKEGHDIYAFMEKMVVDKEVTKVLIICDHSYKAKADQKSGGVGIESGIISQEIYEKVDQEKFIPIVKEYDDNGKAFLPVFLQNRLFIDFSSNESFDKEYERLLRNIFNKPMIEKPALGKPPSFLTENEETELLDSNNENKNDSLIQQQEDEDIKDHVPPSAISEKTDKEHLEKILEYEYTKLERALNESSFDYFYLENFFEKINFHYPVNEEDNLEIFNKVLELLGYYGESIELQSDYYEWVVGLLKKYFKSDKILKVAVHDLLFHHFRHGRNVYDSLKALKLSEEIGKNKHITLKLASNLRTQLQNWNLWNDRYKYKNWLGVVTDFLISIEQYEIQNFLGDLTELKSEYVKVKSFWKQKEGETS